MKAQYMVEFDSFFSDTCHFGPATIEEIRKHLKERGFNKSPGRKNTWFRMSCGVHQDFAEVIRLRKITSLK